MESAYLNSLALFGVGGAHPGGLQLTKKILSREKIPKSTRILDAGCGTGQTSSFMAKKYGCHVTALDCNGIMLEKARKRFQSLHLPIDLRNGSTENLPFEDGSFDIVLSESVMSFTDLSLTIPEFKRVLKSDGIVLAIEMVREKQVSGEKLKQILNFYGMPQLLAEQEWISLFKRAGFNQIHAEKFNLQPDEHDSGNVADFLPSNEIEDSHYEALEKHHYLSTIYKDILGCRIFRCKA
ncbi:class I SAM-dependent methyltransferase [Lederbergia citrea]|uniref:Class I SAM-dependent methyltransferase n=1 Tax=Lederbergia citrea TaxID=2833581 RepID=A0A942UKI4_9BACI|nr:class I SAM-dependent methyltransferase [Lederbergia citrea]